MPKNKIEKVKTIEEIKRSFESSLTGYDADYILRKADKERDGDQVKQYTSDTAYYKAMSLFEFDKGILLLNSVPELYAVFAVDFSKNLQNEYDCKTPSEKSLAEVVTLNFVRVLEAQRKLKDNQMSVKTRYDVQYVAILSKDLDRAERHYLTSLQALRSLRNPSFEVNIKANNAVVGNNQAIQVKNS